jgi:hypothetical protein
MAVPELTAEPLSRCYACGAGLEAESVATEQEALKHEQWDDALVVSLEGGYGMFIDPIGEDRAEPSPSQGVLKGSYRVVICHDCAHQLCEKVPWLNRLIKPLDSHAHRVGRDWSGHEGWDLPHKLRPEMPSGGAGAA